MYMYTVHVHNIIHRELVHECTYILIVRQHNNQIVYVHVHVHIHTVISPLSNSVCMYIHIYVQ